MKWKEHESLVAVEIETMHGTDIFLGLGWGAEATDVTGMTMAGGGLLAGAGVVALSSSSLISTLRICTQGHMHTWMQQTEYIHNWSDYIIGLISSFFWDIRGSIYLLATNDGLLLTGDVPVASCWDLRFLKNTAFINTSINAHHL